MSGALAARSHRDRRLSIPATCYSNVQSEHDLHRDRSRGLRPAPRRPCRDRAGVRPAVRLACCRSSRDIAHVPDRGRRQAHPAAAAAAFGEGAGLDDSNSRIRLGAVVEMLHTATLVHDDIIDEADTRRGRPSSNTTWGNAQVRARGRLALHAGVPDGARRAQLPRARSADLADAADGRRRAAADGEARPPDQRGRVLRPDLSQDGVPVQGLDAAGRGGGRRCEPTSVRPARWASTAAISGWRSRSSTTCST